MEIKAHGKPFIRKGLKYVHTLIWYKRLPFKFFSGLQWCLWRIGIDWHMKMFGGQCTPDFSCCKKTKIK